MNDYVMRILIRSISYAFLRIKDCSVKIRDAASYVENENEIVNNNEMNQNSKQIQRKEIGIIKQQQEQKERKLQKRYLLQLLLRVIFTTFLFRS